MSDSVGVVSVNTYYSYSGNLYRPDLSPGRISQLHTAPERHQTIAEAAYSIAERRGFAPGHELSDWLAAEREVDRVCGLSQPCPRWADL
jgi:Protein of unknown function (DUF2934)